jgi:hypothetical protein
VKVQYQKNCGSGKKFTVSYTNQVVINSSSFSAGGDSGSLIVSNTSSSCRQPVALLYAGSSSTTIGNPIGQVLTKLGTATGKTFSFVGQSCTSTASASLTVAPSSPSVDHAQNILRGHRDELMSRAAVIGVGIGASSRNPSEAAIVIYMDKTQATRARLPLSIDGVSLRVFSTDPFKAL